MPYVIHVAAGSVGRMLTAEGRVLKRGGKRVLFLTALFLIDSSIVYIQQKGLIWGIDFIISIIKNTNKLCLRKEHPRVVSLEWTWEIVFFSFPRSLVSHLLPHVQSRETLWDVSLVEQSLCCVLLSY